MNKNRSTYTQEALLKLRNELQEERTKVSEARFNDQDPEWQRYWVGKRTGLSLAIDLLNGVIELDTIPNDL